MRAIFLLAVSLIVYSCNCDSKLILKSPNEETFSEITIDEGSFSFNLIFEGDSLIKKINPELKVNEELLLKNASIVEVENSETNESWNTVNGKNKTVRNHFNRYNLKLKNEAGKTFDLEMKVYDKGFAYRFVFPEKVDLVTEKTQIDFTDDFTFWTYNGEHHNIGPEKLSTYKNDRVKNPVVFKTGNNNYFAIHEAAIFEHAPFELIKSKNNGLLLQQECSSSSAIKTSWRAFILGNRPGDLVESNLLVNLNEPCKIEDTSWIKPGKSMWDWRVWGYKAADGFEYGLNTISHIRFIDFAAENNIQYLLIDADWYGPEFSDDSDPTSARKGVNIEECMAYAKKKDVGVILYLNDVGAKKFGLERVLKQFSDWGAAGVKYGFMRGTPKEKVLNTRRIVELCAKYKLTVNFHDGPIAPSGDRRTWPNLITKEFCHAQADAKRSYWPETIVTSPFVNMIAGPLDMTNGWFALNTAYTSQDRPKVFAEIPGTVAAEVAKQIVIYSGCSVLPDAPEEYLKKDDLFDCIRQMPAQFDSFKILDGEIGEFITVARQAGNNWFVGSLTNRESRELTIKFDFLEEGKKYLATYYEDAAGTHFEANKESYQVRKDIEVGNNSIVNVKLAPGGGHSIFLKAIN